MDRELRHIEIVNAVPVDQLLGKGVVASNGIDLFSGVVGHPHYPCEGFLSPESQVPSGNVKA